MLYLANASSEEIRDEMRIGSIGMITTPREGRSPADAKVWGADNGCFGKHYVGDTAYLAWLDQHTPFASKCLFATAPDVVGDAAATLERSRPILPLIQRRGFRPALVGQDGLEDHPIPWSTFEVLFIGGTTSWKLGEAAAELTAQALRLGKHVHMGRVNSYKRLKYATELGCHSADGTFLAFGPTTNLPRMKKWLEKLDRDHPGHRQNLLGLAA